MTMSQGAKPNSRASAHHEQQTRIGLCKPLGLPDHVGNGIDADHPQIALVRMALRQLRQHLAGGAADVVHDAVRFQEKIAVIRDQLMPLPVQGNRSDDVLVEVGADVFEGPAGIVLADISIDIYLVHLGHGLAHPGEKDRLRHYHPIWHMRFIKNAPMRHA
jgi:hypothetical protein